MAASETTESRRQGGGHLLQEISNGITRLYRDRAGKGPGTCKAYWAADDLLLVMLSGGFTQAEQLLHRSGHGDVVQESWRRLQDLLAEPMQRVVAELTGREVVASLSSTHQEPDLMAQIFVLLPDGGRAEPGRAD